MRHAATIRPATEADAMLLAGTIRAKDRLEAVQWTANEPEFCCLTSYRQSEVCFAGIAPDGELLGIFGAKTDNLIEETALIWGLSSEAANRHRLAYVANSKAVLDAIMRAMPNVREFHNFVSEDYPAAMRWVEWMGGTFSINGRRKGFGGSAFREFYMENPHYKED